MSIPYLRAAWDITSTPRPRPAKSNKPVGRSIHVAKSPDLLSVPEKLVLIALADAANDQGRCWPSMQTLARQMGISERQVRNLIRGLETGGLIESKRQGGRKSLLYTLRFPPAPDRKSISAQANDSDRKCISADDRKSISAQTAPDRKCISVEPSILNPKETPQGAHARAGGDSASRVWDGDSVSKNFPRSDDDFRNGKSAATDSVQALHEKYAVT